MKNWGESHYILFQYNFVNGDIFLLLCLHLYLCPVLWGETQLLSFLIETWWLFSLIPFMSGLFRGWTQLSS